MKTRNSATQPRSTLTCGAALLLLTLSLACASTSEARDMHRAVVLDAIRFVESGGLDDCPDGDGGRAIGPFQIHETYWAEAVEETPDLGPGAGYLFQDCRLRAYAEAVVASYMSRHVPEAWEEANAEVIARTHDGGPRGAEMSSTRSYWRRVEGVLRARGRQVPSP